MQAALSTAVTPGETPVAQVTPTRNKVIVLPFAAEHPMASIGLASILARTQTLPAVVVVDQKALEAHRRALAEAFPAASIATVGWCHPAPHEPADITLVRGSDGRAAATLAGYQPSAVAILDWPERGQALALLAAAATYVLIAPPSPPSLPRSA
jgi:hypothetical protein